MSAEDLLSPGVSIHETDLSEYVTQVSTSGGAFVGQFDWGPAFEQRTVTNQQELIKYFNYPSSVNTVDWYTASNFLDYSKNLTIVRVITDALNATANGSGVQVRNTSQFFSHQLTGVYTSAEIAAIYPGIKGNGIRISIADAHTFSGWPYKNLFDYAPGTSAYARARGAANDEVHIVVIDEYGYFNNGRVKGVVLEKYSFLSKASDAKGLDNSFIFYGTVLNNKSKYVRYMGKPNSTYFVPTGTISNTVTVTNPGSGYTTAPTITVAPTSSGFGLVLVAHLGTVVGVDNDKVTSVTVTNAGSGYTTVPDLIFSGGGGTGAAASVTYSDSNRSVASITVGSQGTGYTRAQIVITNPSLNGVTATAEPVIVGGKITSIRITNPGSGYLAGNTPDITIIGNGSGATATSTLTSGDLNDVEASYDDWNTPCINTLNNLPRKYYSLLKQYNVRLSNGTNDTSVSTNDLIYGWGMFKEVEKVDANLLILGDSNYLVTQYVIDNICETRKDCLAFFSPAIEDCRGLDQDTARTAILAKRNLIGRDSSFAVMDSGWKMQYDKYTGQYIWTPLCADIAGLCANVDNEYDSWWSPAGFNRGKIKNVISLAFNPNKDSRDLLYQNNINPVVTFKGEGTILFGDKTLQSKSSAFQWINVRRLFIVLEKSIAKAAKYQLFEFNDQFSRTQFIGMVEPYLREVKGRRGMYDYRIICDESNNTPEVVDNGQFIASILIQPARSINFITLNFVATQSGVQFDELANLI